MEFFRAAPLLLLIGCGEILKLPSYLLEDPQGGTSAGGAGAGGSASGGSSAGGFGGAGGSASGGAASGGSASGGAGPGGGGSGGGGSGGIGPGGGPAGGGPTGGAGGAGGAAQGGGGAGPCDGATYVEAVLCDHPIVYYQFETDPPVVLDTMNNVNGMTQGLAVSGALGKGLALQEEGVEIPGTPDNLKFAGEAPFSVEYWSERVEQASASELLIGTWDGNFGWGVREDQPAQGIISPPTLRYFRDGIAVTGNLPLQVDTPWHHYVVVFDPLANNVSTLYADGQLLVANGISGLVSPVDALVFISNRRTGVAHVDEVAVYGYALTEERVVYHQKCLMNGGCQ